MKGDPKITALVGGVVAAWLIYDVATAREGPSMALATLQYIMIGLALLACVGSILKLLSSKS